MDKQKIITKGIFILLVILLSVLITKNTFGELTSCTKTTELNTDQICKLGTYESKDAYFKKLAKGGIWCADEACNQVLNCKTVTIGTETYYTDSFGKGHSTFEGTGCEIQLATPSKGAVISSENIFILYFDNQEITFKFNPSENQWQFSHACDDGIAFADKEAFVISLIKQCSFENNEDILAKIKNFPEDLGFEAGGAALCEIFSLNKDNQLYLDGEKINPLISALWNETARKKEVEQFCLSKIFAIEKKETLGLLLENPPEESKGNEEDIIGVSTSESSSSCTGCKEIDLIWLDIGKIIQISYAVSEKVWSGSQWILFALAYPSEIISSKITPSPTAYDQLIIHYSKENGVTPSIIKAIVEHESGFKPNAISSTGCSGLMQICGSSAQPEYIQVQCKQNRNAGPQKCGACSPWKGDLIWCLPCSGSNCQEDNRFNPEKNIASGAKLFKKHLDSCNGDLTCGLNRYGGVAVGGAKSTYPQVIIKNSQKFTNLDSQ